MNERVKEIRVYLDHSVRPDLIVDHNPLEIIHYCWSASEERNFGEATKFCIDVLDRWMRSFLTFMFLLWTFFFGGQLAIFFFNAVLTADFQQIFRLLLWFHYKFFEFGRGVSNIAFYLPDNKNSVLMTHRSRQSEDYFYYFKNMMRAYNDKKLDLSSCIYQYISR